MKITRRKLAAALATTAAIRAQPAAPEDDLKTKRDRMRADAAALADQKVPMSVEPAFQFKA